MIGCYTLIYTATTTVLYPFVCNYPGEPVPEETFTHSHLSSSSAILISLLRQLRSIASSLFNYVFDSLFCTTSVHDLFGLSLGLAPSTSYFIPNRCLLFAAHAHTIATCFAVVLRLYHLILVFLSTLYLELCLVA